MTYVDYLRDKVLQPLGLASTAFEPLRENLRTRTATGYARRFLSDEFELPPASPPVWAEGGLWSCTEDLARWVSFQLRREDGPRRGAQVLAGSTLEEMHRARYLGDDTWTEAWGIAWYALRKGDVIWVQHGGGIHGFNASVCFDPDRQVGAIALVNGRGDAGGLAMELGAIAREAVRTGAPTIAPPPPTPETYRPLLGIYVDLEDGWVVLVEWRDAKLSLIDPTDDTWRPSLSPTDDPFAFVVEPGVRESGEPAVFRQLPDGRVASLFLASSTLQRLQPVEPVGGTNRPTDP